MILLEVSMGCHEVDVVAVKAKILFWEVSAECLMAAEKNS